MRRSYLYNPKLIRLARKMRAQMTLAEKKLWYGFLRQHRYKWLKQRLIENYIIDFYCPELKLAIEIDGETHLDDVNIKYDQKRTRELEKLGIKILRLWNDDVLNGIGEIENIIEKEISKRT